ncbi:lactonase family protein [Pseudomonas sp. M30-35]|uniref:lactonase family protein n=1 Tax=Pseudomonas sp. M30-35 TaxID=1981174 RepID=UPI000B3C822E|nr:lactonase family protein [Pseudomonas sp. M30-35]ARU87930.1 3-carboxymuconate cyclase [Pseudomonas sp. M30-35]
MLKPTALLLSISSLCACTTSPTMPNQYDLLIGSYTQGTSQGIYRYHYDNQTGRIGEQPEQVISAANPSFLLLSADQSRLFSVNENGPGQAANIGQASSFSIDANNRSIKPINRVDSGGDEPTHASLSADERFLFVANYAVNPNPGGSLSVLPVGADGELHAPSQRFSHPPSRVNKERQASSHVHSVIMSNDHQYLFASDLGADQVFSYRYNPQAGSTPLTPAGSTALPPGSGPRHLLFSNDGKQAYLTLELSNQLAVFDYEQGKLLNPHIIDLDQANTEPASYAAGALHTSADGRFLYVATRGPVSQILVFKTNPADAQLALIQRHMIEGKELREFSLDPSGNHLLVANQGSNEVLVITRDALSGKLGKVQQRVSIGNPSDLVFIGADR